MTNSNVTPLFKPKNKGGRPRKDKKGGMVWIPAELIDSVNQQIEQFRQQAKPNQPRE